MRFWQRAGCLVAASITAVVLLIGGAIGAFAYGYNQLDADFDAQSISPEFDVGLGSVAGALLDLLRADPIGAVLRFVEGVRIEGDLVFINSTFVPLYLPGLEHRLTINGQECERLLRTEATWIAPNSYASQ